MAYKKVRYKPIITGIQKSKIQNQYLVAYKKVRYKPIISGIQKVSYKPIISGIQKKMIQTNN